MEWVEFGDGMFSIHGLPWFGEQKPSVSRLPVSRKDKFREPVWNLAQCPAGGRIRFRTDAVEVGLRADFANMPVMHHMPQTGESGFDVFVDGRFMGNRWPDEKNHTEAVWKIGPDKRMRDVTIHMPLYNAPVITHVGIEKGAKVEAPSTFAVEKPVVFYGSSITQGGCASNPGGTYQDFLSRWLGIDYVNLGFSGQGMGEPELADAINDIDASLIVCDHWANTHETLKDNLPMFVGRLRAKRPNIPIIVVSPYCYPDDILGKTVRHDQRRWVNAFVKKAQAEGDRNIYKMDGYKLISRDSTLGTIDGCHPNTYGFYLMAKGFAPLIKRVLGL